MPKSDLLAVAFTDLNGNDKYNQGKDTLIGSLEDTNNDGVVSIGDTVHLGSYPAIPDGSESGIGGNFMILESTVTDVEFAGSTSVLVDTALGTVGWSASLEAEGFFTTSLSDVESNLEDWFEPAGHSDLIFTNPAESGAGQPNTEVHQAAIQAGDQGFLDVKIFTGDDLL